MKPRALAQPKKLLSAGLSLLMGVMPGLIPAAHADPLSTYSSGPGQPLANQEQNGFINPMLLRQKLANQESVVREMKRREERQEYLRIKSLSSVLKNVQQAIQ